MSNLFHDLYDALKRSEKETLIRKSGSTPEGDNEKIRSGQSYLYKQYGMESIHLYNSGTTGLGINMISCGDTFVLDFKQNFPSDQYVKAFCAELQRLGITYTVSDRISFVTPGDSIISRK